MKIILLGENICYIFFFQFLPSLYETLSNWKNGEMEIFEVKLLISSLLLGATQKCGAVTATHLQHKFWPVLWRLSALKLNFRWNVKNSVLFLFSTFPFSTYSNKRYLIFKESANLYGFLIEHLCSVGSSCLPCGGLISSSVWLKIKIRSLLIKLCWIDCLSFWVS